MKLSLFYTEATVIVRLRNRKHFDPSKVRAKRREIKGKNEGGISVETL